VMPLFADAKLPIARAVVGAAAAAVAVLSKQIAHFGARMAVLAFSRISLEMKTGIFSVAAVGLRAGFVVRARSAVAVALAVAAGEVVPFEAAAQALQAGISLAAAVFGELVAQVAAVIWRAAALNLLVVLAAALERVAGFAREAVFAEQMPVVLPAARPVSLQLAPHHSFQSGRFLTAALLGTPPRGFS